MFEREVKAIAPKWAVFLVEQYGWGWPLWIVGVRTYQSSREDKWQLVSISGAGKKLTLNGNIN